MVNFSVLLLYKTFSEVLVSETQRNSVLEVQMAAIQSILTILDKRQNILKRKLIFRNGLIFWLQ